MLEGEMFPCWRGKRFSVGAGNLSLLEGEMFPYWRLEGEFFVCWRVNYASKPKAAIATSRLNYPAKCI